MSNKIGPNVYAMSTACASLNASEVSYLLNSLRMRACSFDMAGEFINAGRDLFEREYRAWIQSAAREVFEEIPCDRDTALERAHEQADGSSYAIYYCWHQPVLDASDNADAYENNIGGEAPNEAARVVRAIEQDIQDALSELYDDPDEVLRAAWELVKDDPRAKGWTLDENGAEAILSPDGEFWIEHDGDQNFELKGVCSDWYEADDPERLLDLIQAAKEQTEEALDEAAGKLEDDPNNAKLAKRVDELRDCARSLGLDVTEGSDDE